MKCIVKMGDHVSPVKGSVRNGTGTCPTCNTPGVHLSVVGGYMRAHTVAATEIPENNPQPASLVEVPTKKVGTALSEPVVTLVDTGVRIGDPRAAEQRRMAEIEGAAGIGTVQVPRRVEGKGTTKSGKPRMTTKMVDVPATEDHVREALDYWRKRRVTTDSSRAKQNDMVSSLSRRLEAIMAAQRVRYNAATRSLDVVAALPVAEQEALSAARDTAAAHRGPTLVRGRDTVPRLRDPELPFDQSTDLRRNGEVRKSTTFEAPLGRERFDRKITEVPEPAPVLSRSQKRALRQKAQKSAAIARVQKG